MANEKAAKPKDKEKKRGKIKETFGELKKVTWPSFATVVKQTGIVLAVVLVFLVVLTGFDLLLGWLYDILVASLNEGTTTAALSSAIQSAIGGALWL